MQIDTRRFRFLAEALDGSGGFRPSVTRNAAGQAVLSGPSHLVRYPREGDEKFARRNEVAWYVNDLRAACTRFAGYLAQRRPLRGIDNPLLMGFADDCDWRGNNLDVFWQQFSIDAKARGNLLLLVDMPRDPAADGRAVPFLSAIAPEQVHDFELDDNGLLRMVQVRAGDLIRGWNAEGWWVRRGETIIEQGAHPLGICPVLAFGETAFPAEGEFAQIADLSRRLFNLRSELDEILRAQTFSLLAYQVPPEQAGQLDVASIAGQIGTHNMLIHGGQTPAFIAPDAGPARTYLDVIAQVDEKIRRIGHVVEAPDRSESGIALQIRFQQLNSALSHWAGQMEDLERRTWALVCRWLGLATTPAVSWDDNYALTDINVELEALGAMQAGGFSDAALIAKRRQILVLDFSSLEDADMQALLDAEDEPRQERDT